MNKYQLYILAFLSITLLTPPSILAEDDTEIIKKLKRSHRITLIQLGNPARVFFKKYFKNYTIAASCTGSFKNAGDYETILGMINLNDKNIKYVALVYKKPGKVKSYQIAEYKNLYKSEKDIKVIGTECHSLMGTKRINKSISGANAARAGIHGRIKTVNEYDTICITPGPTEFKCFQYDRKSDKFISVGGWIT